MIKTRAGFFLLFIVQLLFMPQLFSQNFAFNGTGNLPDTSAIVDVSSTTMGFLVPRMTSSQMNAIYKPATGLLIFNNTVNLFEVNTGTSASPNWVPLETSQTGWTTSGNTGTNSSNNFLGTTDNTSLYIKTNNQSRVKIDSIGNIGIGTSLPTNPLHINASSNPLRLQGLQSGANIDSVLTVDANGVVHQYTLPGNSSVVQSTSYAIAKSSPASSSVSLSGTIGTFVTLPNTSLSFTLPTTKTVMINSMVGIDDIGSAAGLPYVNFQIYIDNAASGIFCIQQENTGNGGFQSTLSGTIDLAAGSHTLDVRVAGWYANGTTISNIKMGMISAYNAVTYLK